MKKQKATYRLGTWLFGLAVLLLTFSACKEDPPIEPADFVYENGALIVNEGNFQSGNATLSFLSFDNDSMQAEVFKGINERPLGDVAQSVTLQGNRAWVVVNNSGKIEGLGLPSLKTECQITGLTSPRYMLPLANGQALVSDLYANAIQIVDLNNCTTLGQIQTGGWTEEMVQIGNRIFVAQMGTDKVLVIDATTLTLTDSIRVGREPNSLEVDQNGKLWALCSGGLSEELPTLHRIDVQALQVEGSDTIGVIADSPTKLEINAAGDRLYWLNGDVYNGSTAGTLAPSISYAKGSHNFYGLALHPSNDDIYVTDAKDFQRKGQLIRISAAGVDSYEVGINAGGIYFLP